jgi:hypothetical protein
LAVSFNTQVVLVHLDSEETLFTPVGTPRVSTNPELSTVLNTVTHNRDDVVGHWEEDPFRVDTAGVLLELVGDVDGASNWTTSVDLSLHLLSTANVAVLGGTPVVVVGDGPAVLIWVWIISAWWRALAVFADLLWGAVEAGWVLSEIVLARFFGDTVLVSELIDGKTETTFTRATTVAVDEDLWSEGDLWEGVVATDVDTISHGAGGTVSPEEPQYCGMCWLRVQER